MDCGVIKDQRKYWLALRRNPDLPASLCKVLLDQYDNVEAIFHAGTPALARLGLNNKAIGHIQSPDWSALDAELQWAEPEHHHLISYHDHDYPGMLKELHNPPPLLFALGYREIINTVQFAIVGSRNPTGAGKRLAAELCITTGGLWIYDNQRFGSGHRLRGSARCVGLGRPHHCGIGQRPQYCLSGQA